jgi:integrase
VPWRGGNLSFQLSKALAKIPDFPTHRNVHGLRKLCATILTQAGCSTHEIGRVTGHRTLAMIQHYTDSVGQQASAEAAMAKLELWRPKTRMRPR